jgi:uncharacterized membrane-anchored protein YjiN (DUF445 family)
VQTNVTGVAVVVPRPHRRKPRRFFTGRLIWGGLVKVMQRMTRYKRGEGQEFKMAFSVRDLLSDKSRAVKDQVEALVQAVQKAGSYQAREDAARAVHAVIDALKDRVPPDVLLRLSESLPVREAARLRRAAAQRLEKSSRKVRKSGEISAVEGDTGCGAESPAQG